MTARGVGVHFQAASNHCESWLALAMFAGSKAIAVLWLRSRMVLHFPILRGHDDYCFPGKQAGCPVCGGQFRGKGFAYLSAGAVYDHPLESGERELPLTAFFDVGFHGVKTDMSDSGNVTVVEELDGGQFDLQLCSTSCLRQFLSTLVDQLEKNIGNQEKEYRDFDLSKFSDRPE